MSTFTYMREHALTMAGTSTTPANEAAELLGIAGLLGALETMFDVAPRDWWRYVPCDYCNARRQEPCQGSDAPRGRPHVARVRAGLLLHGTLWLLHEYPQDVLGKED